MPDDLSQLPGAPSSDDSWAWKPAGGPQGATPDTGPAFQPQPVDTSKLSPQARHEFQEVLRSANREAYEAWHAKHVADQSGASGAKPEPAAPAAEPAPEPPAEVSPERQALAEQLTARGSDIEAFDALLPRLDDFTLSLEGLTDDQRHGALLEGEQQVIDRLFRGSDGRFKTALAEIRTAALAVGGEGLIKQIDEAGVLADVGLFERIYLMAKTVNSGGIGP